MQRLAHALQRDRVAVGVRVIHERTNDEGAVGHRRQQVGPGDGRVGLRRNGHRDLSVGLAVLVVGDAVAEIVCAVEIRTRHVQHRAPRKAVLRCHATRLPISTMLIGSPSGSKSLASTSISTWLSSGTTAVSGVATGGVLSGYRGRRRAVFELSVDERHHLDAGQLVGPFAADQRAHDGRGAPGDLVVLAFSEVHGGVPSRGRR
jgi:hypothetical protein